MSRLSFVVVGHVDHGKSTLVGRLLADTGSLQEGRLEKVRRICEEQRKPFEYAFLLDALEAEQLQGVTIDVTEVRLTWNGREYLFIDAPGHKEFIKNMITGAAHADAALLLVDAREGLQEQSFRHAYLLSFLGIRDIVVVVSKMDLVGYDRTVFEGLRSEYSRFLDGLHVRSIGFVPISATEGDNVATRSPRLPWYEGPVVLELLETLSVTDRVQRTALRLPVQDVYKFDERRIIAGRIESGQVRTGDEVQVWPSGHRARVRSVEVWPDTGNGPAIAATGHSVGITLDYQLFVQRGDILADPADPPRISSFLVANIFWLGRAALEQGRRYRLRLATLERDVEVFSVKRAMSPVTMTVDTNRTGVGQNEVGEVVFRSARPSVFDVAADIPCTGRFVLLDGYDVVGGGIVQEAEDLYRRPYRQGFPRSAGVAPVADAVSAAERALSYGHRSHVVWLTGVPGAGKTTLARYVEHELFSRGVKTFVIDGENLRLGLSADLAFTDVDRSEQARRAAEVARLCQLAGLVVIVALVSPFRADREFARTVIGEENFTLVYLHAQADVLRQRDTRGLYARAGRDSQVTVPGLNAPYEPPDAGCLVFETVATSAEAIGQEVLAAVLEKIV
jgi:bifunctional enzyme CysN/CysC